MVVIIGQETGPVCTYLEANGIKANAFTFSQIPSLTALLLDHQDITDIVLLEGQEKNWSTGHILAAAKQLQSKGRMVFMGNHSQLPSLISVAPNKEALLTLLRKQAKPADGGAVRRFLPESKSVVQNVPEKAEIRPLAVPPGKILFLGVVGSQHRIGCTTQAVGLWHYCKQLGFDPAVVSSREQIAQIAAPMHSQEIPGGYRIEGIPFVADTALAYDCYILDIGPGSVQDALTATDCLVLVAGSKPWELPHTAAALRAAKGKDMLILLSFSSQRDGEALRPLFGRQAVAVLPWMPELWQPCIAAMTIYDTLLRPVLERILTLEEQSIDEELQLLKGE